MPSRKTLVLVVLVALACSGDDPAPTELRPNLDEAPCANKASLKVLPSSVTRSTQSTSTTVFTITNLCASTSSTWDFIATRTGAVASIISRTPTWVRLAGGGKASVTVTYTTGSTGGTGTVKLTATADAPATTISATQTVNVATGSAPSLPVGVFSYNGIGNGPGNDRSGQKWRVLHYPAQPSSIVAQIQQAAIDTVLLILMMPGNRNSWENATTRRYDSTLYRQQLHRFSEAGTLSPADTVVIANAMLSRRVVCYIVDEPNLPNRDNVYDISPADVAHMAVEHKKRWPQCLTLARVTPSLLNSGWQGLPKPATYPKLDYAWSQYNHNLASDPTTPDSAWEAERSSADGLQLGLAVSLNVWSGGLVRTVAGAPAPCWDYSQGGNLGYILGSNHPPSQQGDGKECSVEPLVSPYPNVVASPAFIQYFAQRVASDGGFPFLLLWNHATNTVSDSFHKYYVRSDFVSAFDNAILTGRGVPAASWRTPK